MSIRISKSRCDINGECANDRQRNHLRRSVDADEA